MDRYIYFLLKKIFRIHFWIINKIPFIKNKYVAEQQITLITVFRNEIHQLPGFFSNVLPHVDNIIGLDDGSDDGSFEFFDSQEKVIETIKKLPQTPHVWNEPENKRLIINAALKHVQGSWVLVLDADERLGKGFGDQVRLVVALANKYGFTVLALKIAELWNNDTQYRCDGIWGKKNRTRLFKLDADHKVSDDDFHAPWHSATVNHTKKIASVDIITYHLGMMNENQRIARRDRYKKLDPDNQWQAVGYDYLTDTNGIRLKPISKQDLDLGK